MFNHDEGTASQTSLRRTRARRCARPRRRAVLLLVALALAMTPDSALAHQRLEHSVPSAEAHLSDAPTELRLTFAEPLELALTAIRLTGPVGAVELGDMRLHPDSNTVALVPIEGPLQAGEYTVGWQTVGQDGHPVRGEFSFTIAEGATGVGPMAEPQEDTDTTEAPSAGESSAVLQDEVVAPPAGGFGVGSPLYVAVRWLTFVGLLGVLGAVGFRLVLALVSRQRIPSCEAMIAPAASRAAQVGAWMAVVVVVAAAMRLAAQSYAVYGVPFDAGGVRTMLARTVWGWGWLLQLLAAGVALLGFRLARHDRTGGWTVAAAGAVALAVTPGLSGHAVATSTPALSVAADSLHVIGAGGWLGGLLLVLSVGVPTAWSLGEGNRGRATAALVNAFSPTALFFAGTTVATGVFAAWMHLGAIPELWQTSYGRTLLLKLGVLAGVFGTGAYNWLRVRPALGDGAAAGRLRGSAAVELAIAAVVLLITAVLVATSPPNGRTTADAAGLSIESVDDGSSVRPTSPASDQSDDRVVDEGVRVM